jgi:peptide/nickel transport system ATP-binding protein
MPATNITTALPLLRVLNVGKKYFVRRSLLHRRDELTAIGNVSLVLPASSTMAIVGGSGAGKSTLARCVAGFEEVTSGEIWIGNHKVSTAGKQRRVIARHVQLIMQDSATALNPRFTVTDIITEPLEIFGFEHADISMRVRNLMDAVGLASAMGNRRPHQLSGGQRQRLAIARALALQPSVLILDEAYSGLDLSVQQRIIELLRKLQQRFALTYLVISHDFRMLAAIADFTAVMYQGNIVEHGPTHKVLRDPQHPHTRALLESVPGGTLVECRS